MDFSKDETSLSAFIVTFKFNVSLLVFALFLLAKQTFYMILVLPKFDNIYQAMGSDIPLPSKVLLRLSTYCDDLWLVLIPMAVIITANGVAKWAKWMRKNGLGPKGQIARAHSFIGLFGLIVSLLAIEFVGYILITTPVIRLISCVG